MADPGPVYRFMAFCKTHGVFPTDDVPYFGEGQSINITGLNVRCRRCGAISEIIPGRYEASAGKLNILIDPSISPEALAAIKDIAERALAGAIRPEEAKKEAEAVHPTAGALFDPTSWTQPQAIVYAAIIAAVGAVLAAGITAAGNYASKPAQAVTQAAPIAVGRTIEKIQTSPDRRAQVNQARRKDLKQQRAAFRPRRDHHK